MIDRPLLPFVKIGKTTESHSKRVSPGRTKTDGKGRFWKESLMNRKDRVIRKRMTMKITLKKESSFLRFPLNRAKIQCDC